MKKIKFNLHSYWKNEAASAEVSKLYFLMGIFMLTITLAYALTQHFFPSIINNDEPKITIINESRAEPQRNETNPGSINIYDSTINIESMAMNEAETEAEKKEENLPSSFTIGLGLTCGSIFSLCIILIIEKVKQWWWL